MPATRSATSHGFERGGAAVLAGLGEDIGHHDLHPRDEIATGQAALTGRRARPVDNRFDQADAVPATDAPWRRFRTCAAFCNDP